MLSVCERVVTEKPKLLYTFLLIYYNLELEMTDKQLVDFEYDVNLEYDILKNKNKADYTVYDVYLKFIKDFLEVRSFYTVENGNNFLKSLNNLNDLFDSIDLDEVDMFILLKFINIFFYYLTCIEHRVYIFDLDYRMELLKISTLFFNRISGLEKNLRLVVGKPNSFNYMLIAIVDLLKSNIIVFEDYLKSWLRLIAFEYSEEEMNISYLPFDKPYFTDQGTSLWLNFISELTAYEILDLFIIDILLKNVDRYSKELLNIIKTNKKLNLYNADIFKKSFLINLFLKEDDLSSLDIVFEHYPFLDIFKEEIMDDVIVIRQGD